MKILKNAVFTLAVLLTSVSLIQAQIDTSKSSGTGTGINTGKDNTGIDNTGIDNTGSMGTDRTGRVTQDTSRTGRDSGIGTGNTGTGTGGIGTGNTGTGTGGIGTGNTGTGTGGIGTGNTGTGTGGIGTGTGDVTGGMGTGTAGMLRTTLQEQMSKFIQAINNGDVNTAVSFYTDDATLLAPDIDIIQGTSGISNFWSKITQLGLKYDTLTTADVRPSSDGQDAHEIGRYFLKLERPGQAAVNEKGKFLVVWKLQADNSWKIDTHMWNRSKQ